VAFGRPRRHVDTSTVTGVTSSNLDGIMRSEKQRTYDVTSWMTSYSTGLAAVVCQTQTAMVVAGSNASDLLRDLILPQSPALVDTSIRS